MNSDRTAPVGYQVRPGFVFWVVAPAMAIVFAIPLCVAVLTTPDQNHLGKYADADHTLEASGARPTVVFIGDSITERWPDYGRASWNPAWINRGIGGERSDQVRARFMQDVVALHPRAVVILVGTNDAWTGGPELPLAMTEANIAAVATKAREAKVRVLLASVPPVGLTTRPPLPSMPTNAERRIEAQNAWMRVYAARSRAGYIDYWSVMRPELTSDSVHPTAAGYAVMARVASQGLAEKQASAFDPS